MEQQVRQIASKYLHGVRPSGDSNLRARCPICDSARAFLISEKTGSWICYSCDERGSLHRFLYKVARLSRQQVEEILKDIRLLPTGIWSKKAALKEGWHVLPEYVLSAYDNCPVKLLDLGFDMDVLKEHDIGFDSASDRITFAIRDYLGRLVAVSGRALKDGVVPRYRVYDSAFAHIVEGYKPSNRLHVYGLHDVYPRTYFADQGPQEDQPIVIVEGYKACIWLRQMGFKNAVALQGSSLTKGQERFLGRIRGKKYVLLDHEPGKSFPGRDNRCQAVRITERLSRYGPTFICSYEEGTEERTSPDDLNKEQATHIIKNAKTLGQYKTNLTKRRIHHGI